MPPSDSAGGDPSDGRPTAERLGREMRITADRLRPVCGHWPAADFDAFVERVTRARLRWTDRAGPA